MINKSITSSPTTLITKGGNISGNIRSITICNNSDNPATDISLHLWGGGGGDPVYKIIHNMTIPSGTTLALGTEDNIAFNSKDYNLRITNAGTDPDLTVIIR